MSPSPKVGFHFLSKNQNQSTFFSVYVTTQLPTYCLHVQWRKESAPPPAPEPRTPCVAPTDAPTPTLARYVSCAAQARTSGRSRQDPAVSEPFNGVTGRDVKLLFASPSLYVNKPLTSCCLCPVTDNSDVVFTITLCYIFSLTKDDPLTY